MGENEWRKEVTNMSDLTLANNLKECSSGIYREILIAEAIARLLIKLKFKKKKP